MPGNRILCVQLNPRDAESHETKEVGTWERDGSRARRGLPREEALGKDQGHGFRRFCGWGGDLTVVGAGRARR